VFLDVSAMASGMGVSTRPVELWVPAWVVCAARGPAMMVERIREILRRMVYARKNRQGPHAEQTGELSFGVAVTTTPRVRVCVRLVAVFNGSCTRIALADGG
jgi:hypothetical protein